MLKSFKLFLLLYCLLAFPLTGYGQEANPLSGVTIKALRGQNDQQKDKDSMECAQVTKEQMQKMQGEGQGQSSHNPTSGAGRGVARGAAGGAIRREVIDGDPGRGAMVGAVGGGVRAGIRGRMMEKKEKAAKQAFFLAFSTCMQERGYNVSN